LTLFDFYQSPVFDIQVPQPTPDYFEFQGLRFYPDQARIVRLRDDSKFFIRPKEQQLLTTLVSKPGETVTYKELWTTLWPEIENLAAARRTMTETRSTLDKLLREILKSDVSIIQTISTIGYRIQGPVVRDPKGALPIAVPNQTVFGVESRSAPSPVSQGIQISLSETFRRSSLFSAYPWHALGSCVIYSLAFVCVLFLEVSYNSDRFWHQALKLSPAVFSWIFITSIAALFLDWKLTLKRGANTLPLLILMFIGSALLLYGALSFFLPSVPITQATFQTQTAQAAYLKNITLYFLPLAIVFLIIPLHLIASLKHQLAIDNSGDVRALLLDRRRASAPRNSIYLKPKTLGLLLLLAAVVSLPSTYWLLDHLKVGPYMNRFMLLVMCRQILYFGLGCECLLWYSKVLNEIKHGVKGGLNQT
jgi:DNA-binding winged helix-turn-helix (wHTH) protein